MSNYNSTHTGAELDTAIGRVLDGGSLKTQVDTNTSDIAALGTRMTAAENILNHVDAEPTPGSDNLVKSGGVHSWVEDNYGKFIENTEFLKVYTDSYDRILWAIKSNGDIYYGLGCPQQVKDYIEGRISELSLDEYDDIVTFLGDLINGDTLSTLLDAKASTADVAANYVAKEDGKSLINSDYADTKNAIENPEYLDIITDSEDRIIESIKSDGTKVFEVPIKINSGKATLREVEFNVFDNPEFLRVEIDKNGHILSATKTDGSHYIHNIESETLTEEINRAKSAEEEINETLSGLASEDSRLNAIEDFLDYKEIENYVELAYLTSSSGAWPNDTDKNDALKHLEIGELALFYSRVVVVKTSDSEVEIATRDNISLSGLANLKKFKYKYANHLYEFRKVIDPRWNDSERPFNIPLHTMPPVLANFDIVETDNEITEYSASDWDFTKGTFDGVSNIFTILEQCYAYMDNLLLANPSLITKYDPVASADYTEGDITVYAIPSIKSFLGTLGFMDYPIFAQGITQGTYTIGDYTANLKDTPAYKTFMYRIHDIRFNSGNVSFVSKRRLYLQAGIHSAEFISQICSCLMAGELVSNNINSFNLLKHFEVWIVPCLEGYGGHHGTSPTALGINANRNFDTPLWVLENVLQNSGYAPADQFSTALSMGIIDYLKPDVIIDSHTLSNSPLEPAPSEQIGEYKGRINQVTEAALNASTKVTAGILKKYPTLYENLPTIYTDTVPTNGARTADYAIYRGCDCNALIEVNNSIEARLDKTNGTEAISISAYMMRNLIYELCKFNLNNYNSRNQ